MSIIDKILSIIGGSLLPGTSNKSHNNDDDYYYYLDKSHDCHTMPLLYA